MLDHVVFAVADLADGVRRFADLTGVAPAQGGRHVGLGTANWLVGLGGGAYLEIVGPDPDAGQVTRPRPFGVDTVDGSRVVTWATRTPDMDASLAAARAGGYDPGRASAMSRRTVDGELLSWRLTLDDDGHGRGPVPFLIDWGSTPHPSERALPQVRLTSFELVTVEPDGVRAALSALGETALIVAGNRDALIVRLDTPNGTVVLS